MAITNTAKLAIGLLSAGGLVGAGVAGYSHFSKEDFNFKKKLGVSVLKLTGSENQKEWVARLEELKKIANLPNDLNALKTAGKTWTDLQKWCSNNSTSSFEKEINTKYQNFEKFCTWKVGDKEWTKKIDATTKETDAKWGTAHEVLKTKEGTLSGELKEIAKKTNTGSDNADRKAIHKWCTDVYKKTWTGENDKNLKEVSEHCREK